MSFRSAFKLLRPYRAQMCAIMALALVVSAIAVVTPFVNRDMLDDGLLKGNTGVVIRLVLVLILLQVGGQFIEYIQRRIEINISNALGKKLKTEAFEHGLKLKPHYFKEEGFYKTISDALYYISNILGIANNSFLLILVIICRCIGAMIGLVILDWRLSIFIALIMPLKVWLNAIIRKHVECRSKQLMEDNKRYNSWLSNILTGITDIKLWNLRKKITAEYGGHVETINQSSKKLSLLRAKNNLLTFSMEFALMNGMYILGAYLIAGELLTFGGLMAFITFAAYVQSPVNIIMELRIILKQITPSVEGLKRFYELEEENYAQTQPITDSISVIEFKNVSLSFGDREILKDFNLTVNRGDKVAITGPNGSGKTTILGLLLRLYEPTEGEILIDGAPITQYNIEDYRLRFSVVSQDIHLFKGTVRGNITFDEGAEDDFTESDKLQTCMEFVNNLEDKYETQVGADGAKLSGGERQKIALRRALHRKSQILLLDEPTSNYNRESEEEFNRFFLENDDYGFYFIVTHQEDILPYIDKVITLPL